MKRPSFGDALALIVACGAVTTGALGAYLGTLACLVALASVLTSKVLAGKNELRGWSRSQSLEGATARVGPIAALASTIHDAARGDRYARTELSRQLAWLVSTKRGDLEGAGRSEVGTAGRALLAGSRNKELDTWTTGSSGVLSRARGKSYITELRREMESIRDE